MVGTGTNNTGGLTVKVNSDGLMVNGGDDIDNSTGAVTSGQEEYGFYISDDGVSNNWVEQGSFATQHQAVPTSETAFAVININHDYIAASADEHLEVTHAASMDAATVVGTYQQVVTYTAYTN